MNIPLGSKSPNVEHDQIATVVILSSVMGFRGAAESMHWKNAITEYAKAWRMR
jgi:hypothetical protein